MPVLMAEIYLLPPSSVAGSIPNSEFHAQNAEKSHWSPCSLGQSIREGIGHLDAFVLPVGKSIIFIVMIVMKCHITGPHLHASPTNVPTVVLRPTKPKKGWGINPEN